MLKFRFTIKVEIETFKVITNLKYTTFKIIKTV